MSPTALWETKPWRDFLGRKHFRSISSIPPTHGPFVHSTNIRGAAAVRKARHWTGCSDGRRGPSLALCAPLAPSEALHLLWG